MKGADYYYREFSQLLVTENPELAVAFTELVKTHQPNEIFLWLEEKRRDGVISSAIDISLTEFFWEIR